MSPSCQELIESIQRLFPASFFHTVYTWLDMLTHMDAIYIYRFIYIICIYLCTEEALNYTQTSFFFSFPLNCFVISLAKKEHKMYKHNVLKKNVTRKGEWQSRVSQAKDNSHNDHHDWRRKKIGNWWRGQGWHVTTGISSGNGLSLGSYKYAQRRQAMVLNATPVQNTRKRRALDTQDRLAAVRHPNCF